MDKKTHRADRLLGTPAELCLDFGQTFLVQLNPSHMEGDVALLNQGSTFTMSTIAQIDNASRAVSFDVNAGKALVSFLKAQDVMTARAAGMFAAFVASFVAHAAVDADATPKAISSEFGRRHPDAKAGTAATYRSEISKVMTDGAIMAKVRAPFTNEFLAMATAEEFSAQVGEGVAIVSEAHAAMKAKAVADRDAAKAKPQGTPAPSAPVVADETPLSIEALIEAAKAAIDAIREHGGANAAGALAMVAEYATPRGVSEFSGEGERLAA